LACHSRYFIPIRIISHTAIPMESNSHWTSHSHVFDKLVANDLAAWVYRCEVALACHCVEALVCRSSHHGRHGGRRLACLGPSGIHASHLQTPSTIVTQAPTGMINVLTLPLLNCIHSVHFDS